MLLEQRVGGRRDRFFIRAIAGIVVLVSIVVIYGWIASIPLLTSVFSSAATMELTSAVCFILCGFALLELSSLLDANPSTSLTTLPLIAFTILLLLGGLVPSNLIGGGALDAETHLITELSIVSFTLLNGTPSIASIVCFSTLAVIALLASYRTTWLFPACKWGGAVIGLLGSTVLVGYVTRIPLLQSSIPSVSKAMAVHSALLFCLIGAALHLLSRGFKAHINEVLPIQ